MDVRDGWHEADGLDPGGVRETGGCIDERQSGDRGPVEPEEIDRFVGAIEIRRGREGGSGRLHLDDDGKWGEWSSLHERAKCGIDLRGPVQ